MARWAAAFVVLGLALGWYFLQRGPAVSTPSQALAWTTGPLDAGALDVEFTVAGVEFLHARDATEPTLSFAVVRRGAQHFTLDSFNAFHRVETYDGRLWALGESQTEGPGPTLELLVSEDEGRSFELRASVPKPSYLATFEDWSISGNDVRLVLSLDDELQLPNEWLWPWWQLSLGELHPTVGPGRFALHSKNGGRSWRFER